MTDPQVGATSGEVDDPKAAARGILTDRTVQGIVILHGVLLVLGTLIFPVFHLSDEPFHADAVVAIGEEPGWPHPGERVLDPGIWALRNQVRIPERTTSNAPHLLSESSDIQRCHEAEGCPYRLSLNEWESALSPAQPGPANRALQHPPLYYSYVAVSSSLLTALLPPLYGLPAEAVVVLYRLLSALLLVPLPLIAAWLAARAGLGAAGRRFAASAILLVPAFYTRGGTMVNNDALVTLLTGLLICWIAWPGAASRRHTAVGGVLLGLALFTKGTALVYPPVVLLALWVRSRGLRERATHVSLAAGVALLAGGWWWLRNIMVYGAVQPFLNDPPEINPMSLTPVVVSRATIEWGEKFFRAFWGLYVVQKPSSAPLRFWTLFIATLALVVVGLALLRRVRWMQVALVLPVLLLLSVWGTMVLRLGETGLVRAAQGRYMYPFLCLLAVAVAATLARAGSASLRATRGIGLGVILVAAYAHWDSFVRAMRGQWSGANSSLLEQLHAWQAWTPVPLIMHRLMMASAVLAFTLVAWLMVSVAEDDLPSA